MNWIEELSNIDVWKIYSQSGEESYLKFIFDNIGTENKHFVDIGAGDGKHLSNTLYFEENGWHGLMIDSGNYDETTLVHPYNVTCENVLKILILHSIPRFFDLLSIDIDGNDYWVLEKILCQYRPRVIIAEFNSMLPVETSLSIKYDENFVWKGDSYFGFSLNAGKRLAEKFGYNIIFQNDDMNCYFVRKDLIQGLEIPEVTYKQNDYFKLSERTDWVEV